MAPEGREELEALRARARTLEAEIAAERGHSEAARAVIEASRAAVQESALAGHSKQSSRPRRWVLGLGAALVLFASILVGLMVRQTSALDELAARAITDRKEQLRLEREVIEIERLLSEERLAGARNCHPQDRAGRTSRGR